MHFLLAFLQININLTLLLARTLQAFGMLNGVWGLGLIVGPAIGGLLSRPHIQVSARNNELIADLLIDTIALIVLHSQHQYHRL